MTARDEVCRGTPRECFSPAEYTLSNCSSCDALRTRKQPYITISLPSENNAGSVMPSVSFSKWWNKYGGVHSLMQCRKQLATSTRNATDSSVQIDGQKCSGHRHMGWHLSWSSLVHFWLYVSCREEPVRLTYLPTCVAQHLPTTTDMI